MNKVSFIIPVFNCEKFIYRCVQSIQEIKLKSYEIILIDDGSTDSSGKICDTLEMNNEYIHCIHQINTGVSSARNRGLELAEGDYIVFVDGDDTLDSALFVELMEEIEKENDIDLIIYGMSFDYYRKGEKYRSDVLSCTEDGKFTPNQWMGHFEELYNSNCISSSCNKIYKTEIIRKHKLWFNQEMFLYEDLEFSLRYIANCKNIYCSTMPVYQYRQTEDEGNAGRRLKRIAHISELIDMVQKALYVVIEKHKTDVDMKQMSAILLSLYLVLAREKIAVSNYSEIREVCNDFISWYSNINISLEKDKTNYIDLMLDRRIFRLLINRNYIAFRHKIAIFVKNLKIYKRRISNE